jgi:hypothetical protein
VIEWLLAAAVMMTWVMGFQFGVGWALHHDVGPVLWGMTHVFGPPCPQWRKQMDWVSTTDPWEVKL